MSFVQSSFWKIFRYPRPEIGTGEPEKHVLFLFRRSATAVIVLCGGGRGGFGPAVVGARAGGGLEHLFVQHGSGACAEGHALRAHVGFSRDRPLGVRRRLLRPAADDG